jgi:uncharacterized protein
VQFLFLLLFTLSSWAADLAVPALTSPVMDEAGLLSEGDKKALSDYAYEIYTHGGPQIQVFIVNDLQGHAIEDFSIKVAEKWQLGTKEKDNGLLILISKADRKVRIEVGNGIEGEITDYDSNQYISKILVPSFREQAYAAGLQAVMSQVATKFNIKTEGKTPQFVRRRPRPSHVSGPFGKVLPIFLVVVVLCAFIFRNRVSRGIFTGAGMAGAGFFLVPGLGIGAALFFFIGLIIGLIGVGNILYALAASGGGRGGGFGGGSSGGGWGGGGGGFSGGGSSGSW